MSQELERIAIALERIADYVETTNAKPKRKTKAELNQEENTVKSEEAPAPATTEPPANPRFGKVITGVTVVSEVAPPEAMATQETEASAKEVVDTVVQGLSKVMTEAVENVLAEEPTIDPMASEEPAVTGEVISTKSQIEEFATDREAFEKLRKRIVASYESNRTAIIDLLKMGGVERYDELFGRPDKIAQVYGELLRHEHNKWPRKS